MIRKYEMKANPLVLTKVIESATSEKHRVMYYDDHIALEFFDVVEVVTPIYDGEEVTDEMISYKKRTFVDSVNEDTGETTQIEVLEDFDFETELAKVENVISSHDYLLSKEPLTETEKLWDVINYLIESEYE